MSRWCRLNVKTIRERLNDLVMRNMLTAQIRPGMATGYRTTAPDTWKPLQPLPNEYPGIQTGRVSKRVRSLPKGSPPPLPKQVDNGSPSEGSPSKDGNPPDSWKHERAIERLHKLIASEEDSVKPDRELIASYRRSLRAAKAAHKSIVPPATKGSTNSCETSLEYSRRQSRTKVTHHCLIARQSW